MNSGPFSLPSGWTHEALPEKGVRVRAEMARSCRGRALSVCLSDRVCGSVRAAAQEAPHQVGGHGADLELVHDVGAVRIYRLDADVQVAGNLPVQAAGRDSWYYAFRVAPVAQLDRVLGYEPRGRGFESCRARHPCIKEVCFLRGTGLFYCPSRIACLKGKGQRAKRPSRTEKIQNGGGPVQNGGRFRAARVMFIRSREALFGPAGQGRRGGRILVPDGFRHRRYGHVRPSQTGFHCRLAPAVCC